MSGSTDIRPIDARAPGAALAPARIGVPRDGSYLATELFVAVALERGLWWLAQDDLHGAPSTEKLAELGEPVVVRSGAGGAQYEALLALPGGVLALVDGGYGHFSVETAAADRQGAVESLAALLEALEEPLAEDTTVSIGFWTRSCAGGAVRHRSLEAPTIDEIALNYTATIERELRRLAAVEEPASGRLLLWRGPPGTGKTHALRALARCWEPWCSTHCGDPEELLSVGPYLLDLLTYDAPAATA